jgi:hypothetical protein
MADYGETLVNLTGCVFNDVPPEDIIDNTVEDKVIHFREYASAVLKK